MALITASNDVLTMESGRDCENDFIGLWLAQVLVVYLAKHLYQSL
jgi:hypothetical protein